jgi:nuclear transcription factor Y gamma
MKLDDDVKMISAEAPVLFAKAAEMFITELTMRAWIHTEDNKRRTLQRNDIAMAITKYDQFDFLIDIVPRDDIKPTKAREENSVRMVPDQVSYYFQLAQQQQQQQAASQNQQQPSQGQPQQAQQQQQSVQVVQNAGGAAAAQPQVIQLQPTQMVNTVAAPPPGGIQIVQQIVGQNGEIQQIPIQLTNQQLQLIRTQMTSTQQQPLVIQTAPIQAAGNQIQQPQVHKYMKMSCL